MFPAAPLKRAGDLPPGAEQCSPHTEAQPLATQTFTFSHATYSSPYVAVRTREVLSNDLLANGHYAPLQPLNSQETALLNRYSSATYFPANPGYYPFLDFDNRVVISQSSYDPDLLQGLTRQQIAADLSDPTNPVTMAIVATSDLVKAFMFIVLFMQQV